MREQDIWQVARKFVELFGPDAAIEASREADLAFEDGDLSGYDAWIRVMHASERLLAEARQDH